MAELTIGGVSLEEFLSFFLLFILAVVLAQLTYGLTRRGLDDRLGRRRSKLLANVLQYTIIAVGTLYGLVYLLGLDLTAMAASLGIIGIAVAFSSQQIIQNFVAGVLIAINRPIQIEDWVEVGGFPTTGICRVKDITLMSTILRDDGGRLVYMPNSIILSSKIINYTHSGFTELSIPLEVPREADLEMVREMVLQVADGAERVLPNVSGEERRRMVSLFEMERIRMLFERAPDESMFQPRMLITGISSTTVSLSIRIWVDDISARDEVISDFMGKLHHSLGEVV